MPKANQRWMVLPHGRLTSVGDRILTVVGCIRMPLTLFPRRMTAVRLRDGRLVIFSAIALGDADMTELERFGRPAFMVVPNDKHRLDARAWKDRYPGLEVVAPRGSGNKVADVVPVDTTAPDFGDPDVQFVTVLGTRDAEAALVVRDSRGTTLVVNDLIGNIRDAKGLGGWFIKFVGFAGDEPQIPGVVRRFLVKDRAALRDQLLQWAAIESLERILVSHGDAIEERPRDVLRKLAASL
jgi:hypothetical protein